MRDRSWDVIAAGDAQTSPRRAAKRPEPAAAEIIRARPRANLRRPSTKKSTTSPSRPMRSARWSQCVIGPSWTRVNPPARKTVSGRVTSSRASARHLDDPSDVSMYRRPRGRHARARASRRPAAKRCEPCRVPKNDLVAHRRFRRPRRIPRRRRDAGSFCSRLLYATRALRGARGPGERPQGRSKAEIMLSLRSRLPLKS